MADYGVGSFQQRCLDIKNLTDLGTLDAETARAMMIAAAGAPIGQRQAQAAPRDGVGNQGTVVTAEAAEAKAQRELDAHLENMIGTTQRPKVSQLLLEFYLHPESTSSHAKPRWDAILREQGMSPSGQGTMFVDIMKRVTPGEVIQELLGESSVVVMARNLFWTILSKLVSLYAVVQQEAYYNGGRSMSAKERLGMEETYLRKVLKLHDHENTGGITVRVFLNSLSHTHKNELTTETTMKRETNASVETTPKRLKSDDSKGTIPKAKVTTPSKEEKKGEMPLAKDIPKDFKDWGWDEQKAWTRPHGLCIDCVKDGKIRIGVRENHKHHK